MHRYIFLFLILSCSLFAWPQPVAGDKLSFADSATAVASWRYQPQSFLHRFFMGSNYRAQWQTEVRVPLFRLSASPFTIVNLGGGMQTKSLQLQDAQGKHWALRTVEKDVAGALPKILQGTLVQAVSQDLISASFPYGGIVVGELAAAAGITAARPQLVLAEKDTALGEMNALFAGALCMLEERDPGFDSTVTTLEMLETIQRSAVYRIDQKAYLKVRLFDLLIADWDRHDGNWRWGLRDSAGYRWWVPVPRDRDWAFYQSGGALPWLAQQTNAMRHLVNFSSTPKKLKDQSHKAWMMDKLFLNELAWADWENELKALQSSLNDAAIERAVRVLPTTVYESIGDELVQKLKSRRDAMQEQVIHYYRFQMEDVLIEGTAEAEQFILSSNNDSLSITITVNGQRSYQRSFRYPETVSITIHGNGGDDAFVVSEATSSRIRMRVINNKAQSSHQSKKSLQIKLRHHP